MNNPLQKQECQQPLVSICIPAYNAECFIEETLESALAQDYDNLEIIVSDDRSTDRTSEIVETYAEQGVRLVRQPKNLGMHANWNASIRASKGKYVVKLDADDLLEPAYVTSMVTVMESHPTITFAHCACRLIDGEGNCMGHNRSIHRSFIRSGLTEWPRYVFGPKATNIVMIRRAAFDAVGGYDEKYNYSGDWKMHRELLKLGQVFYNERVLAQYRVHSIGKQGIRLLQAREHLQQLEDMEQSWPSAVPQKGKLLGQARYSLAMSLARSTAFTDKEEGKQILELLPQYGNFLAPLLLALFIQNGGVKFYQAYYNLKTIFKDHIKEMIYKFNMI